MNLNVPKTDSNGQDKSHQKFESMPKPTAVTAAVLTQIKIQQHPKDNNKQQQVNKLLHSNEDTNFIKDNNKTQQQDPQQNGQQYINQDEQTQQNHLDQSRERVMRMKNNKTIMGMHLKVINVSYCKGSYNATTTMYIVGSNSKESLFRIMEISKDEENDNVVSIIEDSNYFTPGKI